MLSLDMTVLTLASGLLDVFVFGFGRAGNGFSISDLRFADVGLNGKFALHAINHDFQMQLAHAGNNRLAGFGVGG